MPRLPQLLKASNPGLRKRRPSPHCWSCGRFARYDAYHARWWCDNCDRRVPV